MTVSKSLNKFKPSSDTFEFREYPFYWVMRLGNRYTHTMEKQLKLSNMNITMWRVALILREHGKISMSEIATHAVGRLPTITKSVYRMQEEGLVKVSQNTNDARVTNVSITKTGIEVISRVIESTSKTINRAFEGLEQSEVETLNNHLKTIFENLE